jgi:hypothetical protein
MAAQYTVTTGSTALVAATAKTVVELTAGANALAELIALDVSFNGTTATAVPVTVEITTFATTGTGTAFTPKRVGAAGTAQATAKINDTVEPATQTVIAAWFVSPTSGMSYQWPLGRELVVANSGLVGIRLTAPAIVNYLVNLSFEE